MITQEQARKFLRYKLRKVKETDHGIVLIHDPLIPPGEWQVEPEIYFDESAQQQTQIVLPEQVSTNSASYQELASWTVTAGKSGKFKMASLFSDTPATGQFRLTINGKVIFADKKIQNILDLPFNIDMKAGQNIKLEGKSDGAITVIFDGLIQGVEFD